MKNLLSIILLGSISLGANADDSINASELTQQFVYQNNEIDLTAVNNAVLANIESEKVRYQVQIEIELEKQLQALFSE